MQKQTVWEKCGVFNVRVVCVCVCIIIISIQPEGRFWQETEPSQATGMALAHCILGSFLGVGCHCFPPPLDIPTFASRCLHLQGFRLYLKVFHFFQLPHLTWQFIVQLILMFTELFFKGNGSTKLSMEIQTLVCVMFASFCILFYITYNYFYIAYCFTYIHVRHWKYVQGFKKFPICTVSPYTTSETCNSLLQCKILSLYRYHPKILNHT